MRIPDDLCGPYITEPCDQCEGTGTIVENDLKQLCHCCHGFGNTVRPAMLVDSEWIAEVD